MQHKSSAQVNEKNNVFAPALKNEQVEAKDHRFY